MSDRSTEVATKKPLTIREHLEAPQFLEQVQKALPAGYKPERFVRVAMNALMRAPKVQTCTPQSVFRCLLDLAALGIEADGRRAHLIPYGKECTLVIDYKGIVDLVLRSGELASIYADIVCKNDDFDFNAGEIIRHKYDLAGQRGPMVGVYVITTDKHGAKSACIMQKADVDAIRARSKSGNAGPWMTDYNEMAKKTVFRRHSKWLTLSPETRDAIEKDDEEFTTPKPRIVVSAEEDPLLAETGEETSEDNGVS